MKQRITQEQLLELSKKGLERLRLLPSRTHQVSIYIDKIRFPLLSIGEMIEFLAEDKKENWDLGYTICDSLGINSYSNGESGIDYSVGSVETLCDDLWEVVKEILNKV